jgi:hypothetical protein
MVLLMACPVGVPSFDSWNCLPKPLFMYRGGDCYYYAKTGRIKERSFSARG